ncbi:MAG: LOG family protein, partial [Rickettsiales bacterium]
YKHLPIIFEDINKLLGAFHHADEINGTYVGNTKGKLDSVIHHIAAFRAGNKTAKGQDYKERVENYLKERGLPAGTQMYIAAEDGGFALPQKVWNNIQVDGKIDGVPADVLKKITPDSKYPEFTGPGSETAPVMSGMLGEYNLMKRVRDAVLSLGSDTGKIPMLQNCAFNMMKINEGAKDDIISVEAHTKNILHFPTDNSLDKLFKDNGGRIGNFLYAKPEKYLDKADEGKTIAELGKEGIAKYSVRARIVDDIYNKMFSEEIKAGYKPDYKHPHKDKVSDEQLFRVGAFGAHDNETLFNKTYDLKLGKKFVIPKVGGNFSTAPSYDILSHIEYTMANNDAFILFPDTPKSKSKSPETAEDARRAELKKLYTLSSLLVSKQLHARDAKKAVIIMNHDGSWNNAIAIHNNLSNIGMTKDHSICLPTEIELGKNINIQSNSYYDVIGTPKDGKKATYEQTAEAAVELLKQHRKGYNVRKRSKSEFIKGDIDKSPEKFDGYTVAVFCSASSENEYLNKSVKNMSYNLSKDGYGIIYGGGDRYTMGAVLDGVMQRRKELTAGNGHAALSEEEAKAKTYIAGYSTRQILKSETKNGTFSPDLNYARQNSDINYRMADMLDNSNVIVAAPGGAGTVQEWTAALILNHHRPKEEQKPIVFFNPKLNKEQTQVWNVALKAVLGEEDYELLTSESTNKIIQERRERRSKELGIYVETSEKEVVKLIDELKKEHEAHKAGKTTQENQQPQLNDGFVHYVTARTPTLEIRH